MEKKLILEGLSIEDFQESIRKIVREEITANDNKKVAPMSKTEACRQLGITSKTLQKVLEEMNLKEVFPADITRILFKYPKYIRKATINYGLNGILLDKKMSSEETARQECFQEI
ncbi:MAG TPA: hypothetical protein DHV48_03310 [Prolixibacteraceae bacterium]|nr:hypothetical protein [Prolixibacteraceae bacterium]